MTITLKPLHLVLIAFIAGLVIAGGTALALSGGGDDNTPSQAAAPSATPEVGLDIAPTTAPAPTTVPPPPTATPPPPVVEAPQPIIRTCPEIRAAGDYLNPEERAFFLANCLTPSTAASGGGSQPASAGPPAPSAPAPNQTGPTEEERAYRGKAQAQLADQFARLDQYWGTPSAGIESDILTLGSIAGNLALQMGNFAPVPPRFLQAHNQLRGTLADFSLWMMKVNEVQTEAQAIAFLNGWDQRGDRLAAAWNDYILVVGLSLPRLP